MRRGGESEERADERRAEKSGEEQIREEKRREERKHNNRTDEDKRRDEKRRAAGGTGRGRLYKQLETESRRDNPTTLYIRGVKRYGQDKKGTETKARKPKVQPEVQCTAPTWLSTNP